MVTNGVAAIAGLLLALIAIGLGGAVLLFPFVWLYRRLNALRQLTQIAARLDQIAATLAAWPTPAERNPSPAPAARGGHQPTATAQPSADAPAETLVRPVGDRLLAVCPHCRKSLRVRPEHVGRAIDCPGCGSRITLAAAPQSDDAAWSAAVGL